MPDKTFNVEMTSESWVGMHLDLEKLRAENERLEIELAGVMGGQVEQLRASVAYVSELRAEVKRLRAAANLVVDGWSAELDEAEMDPLIGKLRDTLGV